jgi:hypothetical protein
MFYRTTARGVIGKWIDGLDDEVQVEFEARFLHWAAKDKWHDLYAGLIECEPGIDKYGNRFEELTKIREITVTLNGVLYRIIGVHFSVWEFVMLIGYADEEQQATPPMDVEESFRERLSDLRQHPHHRQDYELE